MKMNWIDTEFCLNKFQLKAATAIAIATATVVATRGVFHPELPDRTIFKNSSVGL